MSLDGYDALLCDGTHPQVELELMKRARAAGVTVVLDASDRTPLIDEAVGLCDALVASERFASQFAGVGNLDGLCKALLAKGPQTVIVTLGPEGSVGMTAEDGDLVRRPPYEDVTVFDTTGAGDLFHGAIIYGMLHDWPLQRTLHFANVAAGLSCEGLGGRSTIAAVDDIQSRMS